MGNRISGKYAYVEGVGHTKSWQMSEAANLATIMDSASPDGSEAVDGNADWTGSVAGNGYASALYPKEANFAFHGVANGKVGSLVNYDASVLVGATTVNIPVATSGGVVNWTSTFGAQGDVVKETATAYDDDVRTLTVPAKNGKISIESAVAGVYTDIGGVQNITLNFARGMSTYVEAGLTYRVPNNLTANVSFDIQDDDLFNALYAKGVCKKTKIFVTGALFFMFDGIMWGDKTNYNIDRSTDNIVGYSVAGTWSALRTGAALGTIILPDATVLYPAP